jgi:hypothetical protein
MSQTNTRRHYWINVVSHDHVKKGIEAGITQSCHGKCAPLKRMQPGDWVVQYSPKEEFQSKKPCQKFTAIGQVVDKALYQYDMGGGFNPWRRDIDYLVSTPLPISSLLDQLSFTKEKGKYWGMVFRYGFFEAQETDFKLIYEGMIGKVFTSEHD